jgi:beta-lactamase regulating signal transducer with metallopeptidase domain
MEVAKIEQLLEKYLLAQTSIQEEIILKSYFTSDKVASHLTEYQSMFNYFSTNKTEQIKKNLHFKSINKKRIWWSGIAAGLALFMGVGAYQNYKEHKQAEKALTDTKMAFELIAKQLNKGNKAINELQTIDITKNKAFGIQNSIYKTAN